MKYFQFLSLIALSASSLLSHAGNSLTSEVEIVDNGGGSFLASGSLASARFSDNDIEDMGCRLLGVAGAVNQVQCGAVDSAGTSVCCTSTDPFIIEAVQAIYAFSWLCIEMTSGSCDRLFVSTRSLHIPDLKLQKKSKKSKKK
ncbi:MAG: hypothetical protein ABJ308_07315 [Halieaceae bacterium]